MDLNKISLKIFGESLLDQTVENVLETPSNQSEDCNSIPPSPEGSLPDQILKIKQWLGEKLRRIEEDLRPLEIEQRNHMTHRIGPDEVTFDIEQEPNISRDKLTIRSQGRFMTAKANTCVYGGKWQFEVQLQSKGVMQIGFCSNKCVFNENSGVGDTQYSYGFDGSKKQLWHVSTSKYGEHWQTGDVIGVCIDVDFETVEYYKNGVSMGTAFRTLEKGPGIALFPAVSLGFNEALKANFGGTPFKFPVAGFYPLQKTPFQKLAKAETIIGYLVNLAGILSRSKYRKEKIKAKDNIKTAKKNFYILVCSTVVQHLSELIMTPYVIEDKLLPFKMNLCVVRSDPDKEGLIIPGSPESTLGTFLSIMWNYLEEDEIKYMLKTLLYILLSNFTQTVRNLDYERQRKVIVILHCLCNHPETRKFYIEEKFFKKHCLPLFMNLSPPEYTLMTEMLPDKSVWTEGIGGPKDIYTAVCQRFTKSVETLYQLQKNLLKTLINNEDGDSVTPSSRKLFLLKLRKYVIICSIEQRPISAFFLQQSNQHTPIASPVAFSFLCLLVDVVKNTFNEELPKTDLEINPKYFFDGSFRYHHFDRVGGVLSHLRKTYRTDVAAFLGSNHEAVNNLDDTQLIRAGTSDMDTSFGFRFSINMNSLSVIGRSSNNSNERNFIEAMSPGEVDSERSIHEILDLAIIYYYAIAHKHVVKMSSVRDEIAALTEVLKETNTYKQEVESHIKDMKSLPGLNFQETGDFLLQELKTNFDHRENVFAKRSIELSRKQAWYRAVGLGDLRRNLLIYLLDITLNSLSKASDLGHLFGFVPEVYINAVPILLDSILDFSFHDLSIQFLQKDSDVVIRKSAEFLGLHAADARIILANCKDSLLQGLGTLITHETGIKSLENVPVNCQQSLLKALLRPYENRAWGQSNWLLLRFWLGDGFAYRDCRQPNVFQGGRSGVSLGLIRSRAKNESHTGLLHYVVPAYPSSHFQAAIGKILTEEEPVATMFLNSVLSQLNWAFSEFILLLQEIQSITNRHESDLDPKQLKICSMCYELTVSLMRCLEMVISVAPSIIHDTSRQNSDLLLNRICQLVSQVLSRITVPPGCFQFVIDMCLADLTVVTHFTIMTAVLGIIWAMLKDEVLSTDSRPSKVSRAARALLTDQSFQISNLEFALGEVTIPGTPQKDIPRGNFNPLLRGSLASSSIDPGVPSTSVQGKIEANAAILRFSLRDYPSHITPQEIQSVEKLIDFLKTKESLLSDITLPSEDSLCPICCAKSIAVTFRPCNHQSCSHCILQHLMNSKLCFYCKTIIKSVDNYDGKQIYLNEVDGIYPMAIS